MNKHIHRLVFDRRRGMRVPAAEHTRGAGKAASGQTRGTAVAKAVSVLLASGLGAVGIGGGGVAQADTLSASAGASAVSVSASKAGTLSASATPPRAYSATRSVADMVSQVLASGRPNLPVFSEAFRGDNLGKFDDPYTSPDGRVMTILQHSGAIIVNWSSFDIGKGYTVEFKQPDGGRALNKVRGGDASLIDGVLKANGEVMIENGAGIIFGRNARVNVGSLVATALSVAQDAIGTINPDDASDPLALNLYRLRNGEAVFGGADAGTAGFVASQPGAVIQAAAGGKVLMVAPRVVNKGLIETPQGQTVLAAGQTVYLFAPTDSSQRGLIVAVDNFSDDTLQGIEAQAKADNEGALPSDFTALGTVENVREGGEYTSGLVRADKGSINLVGAAIRQKGQLTATTAVKEQNGAIFITAMKDTATSSGNTHRTAQRLGTVEFGEGSITEVLPSSEGLLSADGSQVVAQRVQAVVSGEGAPDVVLNQIGVGPDETLRVAPTIEEPTRPTVPADDATEEVKAKYVTDLAQYERDKAAFDAAELLQQRSSDVFYRSRIDVLGSDIALKSGARIQAPSGEINILAADNWETSPFRLSTNLDNTTDNSRIVMEAGSVVDASGLDNLLLSGQRMQLKAQLFSAELADSPVQRAGVVYRQTVRADARNLVNLGDVSGYYSNLRYTAAELSTSGGLLRMQAQGALMLDPLAKVDFSGGAVTYDAASLVSSVLLRNGLLTLVADALRDTQYSAFISNPTQTTDEELARYGLLGLVTGTSVSVPSQFVGKSAGVAVLAAPVQSIGAQLDGSVRMSEVQRNATTEAGRDPGLTGLIAQKSDGSPAWVGQDDITAQERIVKLPQLLTKEDGESALGYQPQLFTSLRPTAGLLVVGREVGAETKTKAASNLVSAVQISAQSSAAPTIQSGLNGEAWQALIEQVGSTTALSVAQIQQAGLGALTVFADHVKVGNTEAADAPVLDFTAGAQVLLKSREGDVDINGQLRAAGGRIEVRAQGGDVRLTAGSVLDAAGSTRDDRHAQSAQLALHAEAGRGGAVVLKANGSVELAEGSEVNVSGAAWRRTDGSLVTGSAGSITLAANDGLVGDGAEMPEGTVALGGQLSGFDFAQGGTLVLQGLPSVQLSSSALPEGDEALQLASGLYADRGFGTVTVRALGDITVLADTKIKPVLANFVTVSSAYSNLTGATHAIGTRPDGQRNGVNLSLAAATEPNVNVQYGLAQGANLTVQSGAEIDVGIAGSITLQAGGSLELAGSLKALAGQVSLGLLGKRGANGGTDVEQYGYLAGQSIHLASGSLIDVSGAVKAVRMPNMLAQLLGNPDPLVGEVLSGGTVTLGGTDGQATRGQLLMDEGATIKLNGATAQLSSDALGSTSTRSAAAGTLNIMNTDGFSLLGTVEAKAPDASVAGGTLNMALSKEGLLDAVDGGLHPYPDAKLRTIRIADTNEAAKSLNDERQFGQGVMSAQLTNSSGFDRIGLRADESIQLNAGVNLKSDEGRAPLQSVVLDAPVIELTNWAAPATEIVYYPQGSFKAVAASVEPQDPSGEHIIQAHHVAIGPITRLNADAGETVKASDRQLSGQRTLIVQAGLIEVNGDTAVQGAKRIDLNATLDADNARTLGRRNGEIRFIGQRPMSAALDGDRSLRGQFSFNGALNLTAGVVYATTMSNVTVQGTEGSTLTVNAPAGGSTSQTPLSALASLALNASTINLDGVIQQPVGQLQVTADTLNVGEHARLSVSADGVTVPVGSTINNTQWVYSAQGAVGDALPTVDNVVQDISELPISKQIVLNGKTMSLSSETMLEAQAGGDIAAWQFNPGVGGSTDTYLRPGVFAVLPNYSYDFAPYDADIRARTNQIGTDLKAGDQVTITTANGVLAAGTYTLVDARYGILPGAVLVSATSLNVSSRLPVALRNDDGSVVVSGFRTATGTAQNGGNDARLALVLEPEATFRAKSEVQVTSGNAFQAERSRRTGQTYMRPGDAGTLSLQSENAFDWTAQYNLKGKDDFKAGAFDLALPDIVVNRPLATALEALGADSILLGGVRSQQADGTVSVERVAENVTVSEDTGTLSLQGELLVVATQGVTVEGGVAIESTGADDGGSRRFEAQRDGAQLLVSHRAGTDVASAATTGDRTAVLTVGGGEQAVRLSGASVQLDSTGQTTLAEQTKLEARALGLGAASMVVGDADDSKLPADAVPNDALKINGELLNRLNQAERVSLRANAGAMAIAAGTQLGHEGTRSITLDAPQVLGVAATDAADDAVRIVARNVTLRNSSGQAVSDEAAAQGQGVLRIEAQPVLTDGHTGGVTVAESGAAGQRWGFDRTEVHSTGDIVFSGTGMTTAKGDVQLDAARVTADSTSSQTLKAEGDLEITQATAGKSLNESLGAGGKLALEGRKLTQAGTIDIDAGRLTLTGRGDAAQPGDALVFAQGSTTSVNGRLRKLSDSYAVASGGGQILAQATNGRLVVEGTLSAAAPVMPEGVSGQSPEAGRIALQATGAGGQVVLGEQARVDVSAAAGQSGEVAVDTRQLALSAAAQQALVAQQAQSALDHLAAISRNDDGSTLREFSVRQREGDLSLNTQLAAARVALSTDAGSISLGSEAQIKATTAGGGVVQLQAGQDLVLNDRARIEARSTREGANGGDVLLAADEGSVKLGAATVVADSEDDALDGRIVVRARQSQNAAGQDTGMKLEQLAGSDAATLQAGRVQLAGVRVYDGAALKTLSATGTSSSTNLSLTALTSAATSFASTGNETAILAKAGLSGTPNASVRAESEIRAAGDFTISNDVQMAAAAKPMNLTVRAGGNLNVNGSVSAGLSNVTTTTATIQAGEGASLRFVAGADLGAADVNATLADASQGHFTLASNKLIRTTTGSIDVHAAGDVRLMASTITTPASIYVTGGLSSLADDELFAVDNTTVSKNRAALTYKSAVYTERGERLTVHAGGRVGSFSSVTSSGGVTNYVAQQLSQGTGNYFYHGGNVDSPVATLRVPVSWWSGFNEFRQGFGSFGGGNIDVQAGSTISDVAVVSPTNARSVLHLDADQEVVSRSLKVLNGGDVNVVANGDILGGVYFLGRGDGRLVAGGSILAGADSLTDNVLPKTSEVKDPEAMFALMDGHWSVRAVDDLRVSHVYNPTVVPFRFTGLGNLNGSAGGSTAASGLTNQSAAVFYTYANDAGVSLSSLQGDVSITPNSQNFNRQHAYSAVGNLEFSVADGKDASVPASVLPPVFSAISLAGNLLVDTSGKFTAGLTPTNGAKGSRLFVMPSAVSDVNLYAAQDLTLRGNVQLLDEQQVQLGLPDVSSTALFPTSASNTIASSGAQNFAQLITNLGGGASFTTTSAEKDSESANANRLDARPYLAPLLSDLMTGVFALSDLGQANNDNTVHLYAGQDVSFEDVIDSFGTLQRSAYSFLRTNRPTEIVAGRDINNPNFLGQNFDAQDSTVLSAGRDVNGAAVALNSNPRALVLGGPGSFKIQAGRDVLLGSEQGVVAMGNQINQALPDASAKITVAAGQAQAVNLGELVARHGDEPGLRQALTQALLDSGLPPAGAMASADSWDELSDEQLQQAFAGLKDARQVEAVEAFLNARFAELYLPDQAGQSAAYYRSEAFQRLKQEAMWAKIREAAAAAGAIAVSTDEAEEARRKARRTALFKQAEDVADLAGLGATFDRQGDVNLGQSRVHNLAQGGGTTLGAADDAQGGIDVIAAGQVLAGLPTASGNTGGFINFDGGTFRSISGGDFLAGDQKVIAIGRGNLLIYSVNGSIDSGKGSNTSNSAVLSRREFNKLTGQVETVGQAPTSGSGFQKVETPKDMTPVIGLYAPNGEIRALDAFIKGDASVDIRAQTVIGGDNIGGASGVAAPPAPAVSLSLTPQLADTAAGTQAVAEEADAKAAQRTSSVMTVDLLGYGAPAGAGPADAADEGQGEKKKEERDN